MQNLLLVRGRLNLNSRFPCYVDIVKTSHVDDFGLLSVLVYVFRIFDKQYERLKMANKVPKISNMGDIFESVYFGDTSFKWRYEWTKEVWEFRIFF